MSRPPLPEPRKASIRFKERSELLDFLLEVAAATTLTLDLDQLLADVAGIIHKVLPYDLFAILLDRSLSMAGAGGGIEFVVRRNLSIRCDVGMALNELRDPSRPIGQQVVVPSGNVQAHVVATFVW